MMSHLLSLFFFNKKKEKEESWLICCVPPPFSFSSFLFREKGKKKGKEGLGNTAHRIKSRIINPMQGSQSLSVISVCLSVS